MRLIQASFGIKPGCKAAEASLEALHTRCSMLIPRDSPASYASPLCVETRAGFVGNRRFRHGNSGGSAVPTLWSKALEKFFSHEKAPEIRGLINVLADRVGFEPTEGLTLRRFSRPVPSTARPSVLAVLEPGDEVRGRARILACLPRFCSTGLDGQCTNGRGTDLFLGPFAGAAAIQA